MKPNGRGVWLAATAMVAGVLWAGGCWESGSDASGSAEHAARVKALNELAAQDTETAVYQLEKAAADENAPLAMEAVWALARMQRRESVRALRNVLGSDSRAEVRRTAVVALSWGEDGDRRKAEAESVELLRRVARMDPDFRVRGEAAAALGELGAVAHVEFLVEVATRDESEVVQARAVRGIERLLRVEFGYDPKASAEQRAEALKRVREMAPVLARRHGALTGRDAP